MPTILPLGPQVQFIDTAPPPSTYDPAQYVVRLGALWLDVTNSTRPFLWMCIASSPELLVWMRLNDLGGDFKNNIFIGSDAGLAITAGAEGDRNLAIGRGALKVATTAHQNVAVGHNALQAQVSGNNNTAVGAQTLVSSTTATANTAVGAGALYAVTTGAGNLAVGVGALFDLVTGGGNIAVGNGAGAGMVSQSNSILIGHDTSLGSGVSAAIAIGHGAKPLESGSVALGGPSARLVFAASAGPLLGYLKVTLNGEVVGRIAILQP